MEFFEYLPKANKRTKKKQSLQRKMAMNMTHTFEGPFL